MKGIKPGVAVEYTQTYRGVVVRVRDGYVTVRNKRGMDYSIALGQVLRVVNPEPSASKVLDEVDCPRCGRPAGQLCFDTRYRDEKWDITHPHKQRIEAWVEKTGWTP